MNKIFIIIFISFGLISCSNKSNSEKESPVIEASAQAISVSPAADFGDVPHDQVKLLTLKLSNSSNNGETLTGPVTLGGLSADDFSIVYQSCNSLLVGKSCTLKISLDARGKSSGNRGAVIQFDAVGIPLSANILPAPAASETALITPSSLNFGTLTQTSSVIKTVSIKNTSTIALNKVVSVSPPFIISYDTCSNKNLAPKSSCTVKVSLQGSSTPDGGEVNGTLGYGSLESISLSAQVFSPLQQSQNNSNIVALFGGVEISSSSPAELGSLELGKLYSYTFTLKNKGSAPGGLSGISTSSPLNITYNSCGSSLNAGSSCLIKTSMILSSQSVLSLSFTTNSGIKTIPLNYSLVSTERQLSLIANFSYSQPSSGPASCKAYSPFNPSEIMADLVVQGGFSSEEQSLIQTSVCNYLSQNSSMVSNYNVFTPNQCNISDFNLLMTVSMETGIPSFLLDNNLYFGFNEVSYFIMDSWECDQNLSMFSPTFELSGGGINLTNGVMRFPIEYNNALYYGIKGPNAAYYFLAKSNKLNSVSLVSLDYKLQLDTRFPLVPFDNKLFFVAQYQDQSEYKIFYLDQNDVINEFVGQIPGESYLGIRDNNNGLRMTTNGNYLLFYRASNLDQILKISSHNGPVSILTSNSLPMNFLGGSQGEFIGNKYYPTAYYDNNGFSFLKEVDLVNNTISDFYDAASPILQQKASYPLAKTNSGNKLWFFIYEPSGSKVLEYNTVSGIRTTHSVQGFGINSRTFSSSVSYFSTSSGATYYVYKISDDGLQLVETRFGLDVSVGFIANDGSLVYVEDNGKDIYKINYNQPKTKLFDDKIFYQSQYTYINQNLRDFYTNPKFDNQIVVAMADTNPTTGNIETNFKITFIDLDTLQITKQISVCPSDVGGYDFRPEPSDLHVGSNALFLSVRTCGTSDYQLYQYK